MIGDQSTVQNQADTEGMLTLQVQILEIQFQVQILENLMENLEAKITKNLGWCPLEGAQ